MVVVLIYFDETKSLISECCSGWNIGVKIAIPINETNISIGSADVLLSKFAVPTIIGVKIIITIQTIIDKSALC
jgi:hypothetical protein